MFNIKNRLKSLKKKSKYGAMYMSTVVKVIACVVVGALVISGLAVVTNGAFNTASDKVSTLFEEDYNYAGGAHGGAGGGGAIVPGEGTGSVTMLEGEGQTNNKVFSQDLTFRSSAPIDTFQEVRVNDETVDPSNYALTEGSTIVTLKKSFLDSLSLGEHTIEIVSDSGTATTTFFNGWVAGEYLEDGTLETSWETLLEEGSVYYAEDTGYLHGCKAFLGPIFVISSDVSVIGENAFADYALEKVKVPETVSCISNGAFSTNMNLEYIEIPKSVIEIENWAFGDSFHNANGVPTIRYFGNIDDWNSISIGESAFVRCPEIQVVCNDGTITINA